MMVGTGVAVDGCVTVGEGVAVDVGDAEGVLVGRRVNVGDAEGVTVDVAGTGEPSVDVVISSGVMLSDTSVLPATTAAADESGGVLIRPRLRQARVSGNTRYQAATSASKTQPAGTRRERDN